MNVLLHAPEQSLKYMLYRLAALQSEVMSLPLQHSMPLTAKVTSAAVKQQLPE